MALVNQQLPSWMDNNRRVIRSAPNPSDKSTVVNISQESINEHKPTIEPGIFIIPPGTYELPSILVVGTSSWWREIDEKQPLLEIPHSSVVVAESVVNDYCVGMIEYSPESKPGLFWLPGALTVKEIKEKHKTELDIAQRRQKAWYEAVVKMADVNWARSGSNPLAINDTMRKAAIGLGVDGNKIWMQDFKAIEMKNCPACGATWNPIFPMCQSCHTIIDKEKYKALGLEMAK